MSLKNIWRLRFFINRYSPSDKKKRYMNNKLDELEEQVEKMKCCSNCKHNYSCHWETVDEISRVLCGKDLKSWELKE